MGKYIIVIVLGYLLGTSNLAYYYMYLKLIGGKEHGKVHHRHRSGVSAGYF